MAKTRDQADVRLSKAMTTSYLESQQLAWNLTANGSSYSMNESVVEWQGNPGDAYGVVPLR
jgi:hypothetical protein